MGEIPPIHIIKRDGRRPSEPFNSAKLHASVVAACLSAGAPQGQADTIARKVTDEVAEWLQAKPEVTSHDLRRTAAKRLRLHHPDAAYLYEQHRITM